MTKIELFTDAGHPKRKWRVTLKEEPVFFFAALWRQASAGWPESYAILIVDAAPDILPLNERQPAVIRARDVEAWLRDEEAPRALLKPLAAGSYEVREQDD